MSLWLLAGAVVLTLLIVGLVAISFVRGSAVTPWQVLADRRIDDATTGGLLGIASPGIRGFAKGQY